MTIKYYSEAHRRRAEWEKKTRIPANYSVARAILDLLLDWDEQTALGAGMSYKNIVRRSMGYPAPPRWRYNRAMRYLESKKFVKPVNANQNDKDFFQLTQKGKIRALLYKISEQIRIKRKWDGKWRVILWDIPETSRHERNKIRRFLKRLGYFKMQKSVLASPYPLPREAAEYLTETGLIKYIRFLRVDMIDDDAELIKYFKIKQIVRK